MQKTLALVVFLGIFSIQPIAAGLIVNGDFQTGNLAGWTTFTTPNGLLGASGQGLPSVVSFDTTGSGASLAGQFNVGQAVHVNFTDQQGGGIFQNIFTNAGTLTFHADIATFFTCDGCSGANDAGTFSLLLDGNVLATRNFGGIGVGVTLRDSLSASASVLAGSHEVRLEITRAGSPFFIGQGTQNIDNVSVVSPEPGSTGLVLAGLSGLILGLRRKVGQTAS